MASEPTCNSETLLDNFDDLIGTEFDEELIRELLEEPQADVEEGSAEKGKVDQGIIENDDHDGLEDAHEHYYGNIVHEFDWSEMAPFTEPSDTISSVEDYTDEFANIEKSSQYSQGGCEDTSLDEPAYVGLW